jgi:carboxylesterase type B
LRGKTAEEVQAHSMRDDYHRKSVIIMHGDEFLPDKPSQTLKNDKFRHIDVLFGNVKDEGSFAVVKFKGLDPRKGKVNVTLLEARNDIKAVAAGFGLNNTDEVADYYLHGVTDKAEDMDKKAIAVGAVYGDFHLKCTTVLFGSSVGKFSKGKNAYAYQLTLPPSHSILCRSPKDWTGVCHADDLVFTSGAPFINPSQFTDEERVLSKDIILAWTQFAKTGQLSTIGKAKVTWNQAVSKTETDPHVKYMELNKQYRMVENGYKNDCEGFWKKSIIE